MFQNISSEYQEDEKFEENVKNRSKKITKISLTKQNIVIYVVSFMLSMVGFGQAIAPFGLAMLAAACSNEIPIFGVYLATLLGTYIGFGVNSFLMYFLTTLLFMVFYLLVRPKYQEEERNEKKKVGMHLFFASFIVQAAGMFFHEFLVYDLLATLMTSMSACIFYKIFSNSLIVLKEFGIKKAFTIEEIIGACLLISVAFTAFGDFSVFGFSIRNIVCILLVMILGWKQGILVGATSGITIGVVLGIISSSDPLLIAAFALSGMIAGIFNRFGKPGVIVGFIIGTVILTYVSTGNASTLIYFKEILIASLGLLLMPKNMQIDIEDVVGKVKLLPTSIGALEQKEETIDKLNNVSETISEIAKSYREAAATVVEEKVDVLEELKEKFLEELGMNLEGLEDNMLYEDIVGVDDAIISDLFYLLTEKEMIDSQDILDVLAKYNNYIIGFDDKEISQRIEKDISKMVKAINYTYRTIKSDFLLEQKVNEKKKTMSNQLEDVSKVIASLAEDISGKEEKGEGIEKQEEITLLLKQKKIELKSIKIEKEKTGKYIITLYLPSCETEKEKACQYEKIEKLLSKVLNEKIVLQKKECKTEQNNICKQVYMSEENYKIEYGIAKTKKTGSNVSGDAVLQTRLEDGKLLLALSDRNGVWRKST